MVSDVLLSPICRNLLKSSFRTALCKSNESSDGNDLEQDFDEDVVSIIQNPVLASGLLVYGGNPKTSRPCSKLLELASPM